MPVTGFPDARRHRFCYRCARWFEPEEGSAVRAGLWRPLDRARLEAEMPTADPEIFMCLDCQRRRRIARAVMLAALAVGIAAVAAICLFAVIVDW